MTDSVRLRSIAESMWNRNLFESSTRDFIFDAAKSLGEIERLKARIAELEARPDPPAPAIVIRDRMQWASDRMVESEADGDVNGREAWQGYGQALRWVLGTVDLGASPRPAAIDPDMPRRFRHKFYESDPWKYGVFFPCDWVFVAGGGQSYFYANRDGKSIFPYIEWIDPAPAEKGAGDGPDV